MAAYAVTCWMQLIISSPHKLLGGIVAPAVGAAVAAALWRQLRSWQQQQGCTLTSAWLKGSKAGSPTHLYGCDAAAAAGFIGALPLNESPVAAAGDSNGFGANSRSSSEDSSSNEQCFQAATAHLPRLGELSSQNLEQQQQGRQYAGQAVVTAPAAPYAGSTQMRHQRASDTGAGWAQQQQQAQQQAYHAAGLQQTWQQRHQAGAQDAGWDARSAAGSSSCSSNSSSSSPVRAGVKGPASLMLLPGKGDISLDMGPTAAYGYQGHRKKRDSGWGFAGPAYSRVQGSSQAVTAASILSVVGVAAAAVPLGLQLAAALTGDPTNSGHVVVPMLLLGKDEYDAA